MILIRDDSTIDLPGVEIHDAPKFKFQPAFYFETKKLELTKPTHILSSAGRTFIFR